MSSVKGPAYPVTPEWKEWVRSRIAELKRQKEIRGQNDLARRAGIGMSTISEALADEAVGTAKMPEIHRALGWPPPLLCPPIYILEMADHFEKLSDIRKGEWLEKLRHAAAEERAKRGR